MNNNKKSMKKNGSISLIFAVSIVGGNSFGQTPSSKVIVNEGLFSVSKDGILSTTHDFSNQETGTVKTDGSTYYYGNFNNDNLYYHTDDLQTAKAVFTQHDGVEGKQVISGKQPTNFYDLVLANSEANVAFELQNEANVHGAVDFQNGIVKVDSLSGGLTFHQGAKVLNAKDISHADGSVEKIGNEEFVYPVGNKGVYRASQISSPKGAKDLYQSKYRLDDKLFFKTHTAKSGIVNLVNQREYWTIEKGAKNNEQNVMLTLSWDERTTPQELLTNPAKELHILRWNEEQKMWVDEGGVVNLNSREITTVAPVKGFGYFTLGTVKTNLLEEGNITIYTMVSPNGDGKNDIFLIDNINSYPNNKVEIYNRWGAKVFDTKNYDSTGNVFRGYSDGRVTMKKGEKLPSGTYFYIINYEYQDAQGTRTIKKTGYLHLENN